jgi:hypothetical protein
MNERKAACTHQRQGRRALVPRERRENTRKLAMGPRCGQLALAERNVAALRIHFSLLIANWQRYALTPLLIVIFSSFRVIRVIRGLFSSFSRFSVLFAGHQCLSPLPLVSEAAFRSFLTTNHRPLSTFNRELHELHERRMGAFLFAFFGFVRGYLPIYFPI